MAIDTLLNAILASKSRDTNYYGSTLVDPSRAAMAVLPKRVVIVMTLCIVLAICIAVNRVSLRTINTGIIHEAISPGRTLHQVIIQTVGSIWPNPSSAEPPPSLSCLSQQASVFTEEEIRGIEKFVIFVGYARSGTSIIGSLLDAHPNMIIAYEYMIFKTWPWDRRNRDTLNGNKGYLFDELYQKSYRASCVGLRSEHKDKKGYTLFVNNSWQAQFKDLKVIGDKGKVGNLYSRDASKVQNSYQELMRTVKVPIHSLHVVRNPFDIISTSLLFSLSDMPGIKYEPMKGSKCNNTTLLDKTIDQFFLIAKGVHDMISTCNLTVLEIYSEEFVKQPRESMKRICDFLGVECSPWYLQMCQDKVFSSASRSRDKVEWTEEQIARVQKLINTLKYMKGYNFIQDDNEF